MSRLIAEAAVSVAVGLLLLGLALWSSAPELAMASLLAMLPLCALVVIRRQLTLVQKLAYAGPVPFIGVAALYLAWIYQFPGRAGYFLVLACIGAVFIVSAMACYRLVWEVR